MINTVKDCCGTPNRMTELKFAKDQGFCTTPRYVAFTDHENMIGDAKPIQNTAFDASRLFADPVFFGASAARSVLLSFRQRTRLEMHCESREYRVDVSRRY